MLYQLSYTPRPGCDLCGERQRRKASGSIYDFSKRPDHERGRPSDEHEADQSLERADQPPFLMKGRAGRSQRCVGRGGIEKGLLHRPHGADPMIESRENEDFHKVQHEQKQTVGAHQGRGTEPELVWNALFVVEVQQS